MYSAEIDVTQPLSRPGSDHKPDEVFLLPHEQTVHNTTVDSRVLSSDGESLIDELDQFVHIDTDMSSLLQVMDSQLVQCSNRSGASDRTAGCSRTDTEPAGRDSELVSENQHHHHPPSSPHHSDDGRVWQLFHEYDPVYVPHNDAAAMARRVDDDTSYVRTQQSLRSFSPYEEVCYGVRPLLLSDRPPVQVHQRPAVPPRTSSIAGARLQNSSSSGNVVERVDGDRAEETHQHSELSRRTSTVSEDVDAADAPYESIVINPTC